MFRKTILTLLVLLGFMFSEMAEECLGNVSAKLDKAKSNITSLIEQRKYPQTKTQIHKLIADYSGNPDLPEVLYDIAGKYGVVNRYQEEKEIYQQIVQNYPDSSCSSKAQLGISKTEVLAFIVSRNFAAADQSLNEMVSRFPNHPNLPDSLYLIAERYRWVHEFGKAKNIYRQISQNHPDSSYANKARLGVSRAEVISLLVDQDYNQAAESTNKLIADFSGHPDLPETLYWIARGFGYAKLYEEEMTVYQQIIQGYPDNSYANKARLGLARANIMSLVMSKNYDQAAAAVDKLITDFAGYPDLPRSILEFPEQYYGDALQLESEGSFDQAKDLFKRVLEIHEKVKNRFPNHAMDPERLCRAAICYRAVDDYEKSTQCCQKIVDDWPNYAYAWQAQYLIGCNYEDLKESGAVSKSQADAKAEAAYQRLLENYPDCPAAETVRARLAYNNSKKERSEVK